MTFSFTSSEIAKELIQKNVTVEGIFERTQNSKYSQYSYLLKKGANVSKNINGKIHHKVFIIDEEIVITGSMNPTSNGDKHNDEALFIIHDNAIATQYVKEYKKIKALNVYTT